LKSETKFTRELASQIHDVFASFYGESASTKVGLVTSGTKLNDAAQAPILVGTPGRLASLLLSPRSTLNVGDLDSLILDEADRLLSSPDHRRDVERIMRFLPKQRRTHLFSATMTDAVEEVVGLGLRNPVRIVVNLRDKREDNKERRMPMG
jgi:ATP-dependent RNA helicase DDX55/SPB4